MKAQDGAILAGVVLLVALIALQIVNQKSAEKAAAPAVEMPTTTPKPAVATGSAGTSQPAASGTSPQYKGMAAAAQPTMVVAEQAGQSITTATGLKIDILEIGTGAQALPGHVVVVNYKGTLQDGTVFDSTDSHGPFSFPLGAHRVIKGWDEGVAGMKIGEKRKLTIPPDLGYGANGTPGGPIPPQATLTFEVVLLDVK
jgi:peptidylprolyl isomerase